MSEPEMVGCLDCSNVFERYPDDEVCIYCGSLRIKNTYELLDLAQKTMTGMDANYREMGDGWDD